MDYKKMKNIVDGIVKNEFRHIQETLEKEFTDTNLDYRQNRSAIEGRIVNTTGKMAILLLSQLPYLCSRENEMNH